MRTRLAVTLCLVPLFSSVLWCQSTPAPIVRFHTNLGDIDVTMIPTSAPKTVANFLNYMNNGAYNNSIFHRSVPGFIIQGGGFQLENGNRVETPADPPVVNEFKVSNTRGTLAMAKLGGDPNSATNQWFFNLADNRSILDGQNGGFTVFGRVANAASLAVMDKIAAVPIAANVLPSPYDQIPLIKYGDAVQDSNYVLVLSVAPLTPPAITSNGIITPTNFGAFAYAASGSFIEIYGSNLAGTSRGWAGDDFTNDNAPSSLDGVTVTVNGKRAYVSYVSPGQVNAQVPADLPDDPATPVVVTYKGQSSAPAGLIIKSLAPGLLAPPSFKVGDKQYVAAVHSSSHAFVSNGSIPDLPASPAVPGETLIFYGVGFGPVNPGSVPVAGRVVDLVPTALSTPVEFKFGETTAQVTYAGFISGLVGVYQFNVVVPSNTPDGDQPLTVILGPETVPQTLLIPVKK